MKLRSKIHSPRFLRRAGDWNKALCNGGEDLHATSFLSLLRDARDVHIAIPLHPVIHDLATSPRPLSREESAAVLLIHERWGKIAGERHQRLLLDVFTGKRAPTTPEQEKARERLYEALMEYVDEDPWRSRDGFIKFPTDTFIADSNYLLWSAVNEVLLAWGLRLPRHFKGALAYQVEDHYPFLNMVGPGVFTKYCSHSPVAIYSYVVERTTLLSVKQLGSFLRGEGRADDVEDAPVIWREERIRGVMEALFTEEELALIHRLGREWRMDDTTKELIAPHLPRMTWDKLLQLAQLSEEYNLEWAVASMEW